MRVGRRIGAALRLLLAAAPTAVPWMQPAAALAPSARAASAKLVSVAGTEERGYGRIALTFDTPVAVKARVSGAVLVLSFARPASLPAEKLAGQMPRYVSVARGDPDGTGMRAALQTEAGAVPNRVLVQPAADGTEILLAPHGGSSVVWLGLGTGAAWRPMVGYPVFAPAARRLPTAMKGFYDSGASLVGPFENDLEAGKTTEIRLRAPGAASVVAFQGPDLAGQFVRDGDAWVLRTEPTRGAALEVMASYDDPQKFQGLLTYDVR